MQECEKYKNMYYRIYQERRMFEDKRENIMQLWKIHTSKNKKKFKQSQKTIKTLQNELSELK